MYLNVIRVYIIFGGKIQNTEDTYPLVSIRNDRETHAVIETDDVSSLTSEVKKGPRP